MKLPFKLPRPLKIAALTLGISISGGAGLLAIGEATGVNGMLRDDIRKDDNSLIRTPGSEARLEYAAARKETCVFADEAVGEVQEIFNELSFFSPMGKKLVELLKQDDILMCQMDTERADLLGYYKSDVGSIYYRQGHAGLDRILAHESAHHLQKTIGKISSKEEIWTFNLEGQILYHVAEEAAARTLQIYIAHEMMINGHRDMWDHTNDVDGDYKRVFNAAYLLERSSVPEEQARLTAAQETFQYALKDPVLLDMGVESIFALHASNQKGTSKVLNQWRLRDAGLPTSEQITALGVLPNGRNFIEKVELPDIRKALHFSFVEQASIAKLIDAMEANRMNQNRDNGPENRKKYGIYAGLSMEEIGIKQKVKKSFVAAAFAAAKDINPDMFEEVNPVLDKLPLRLF